MSPITSTSSSRHLQVLPNSFFVVQLPTPPGQELPPCIIKDLVSGSGGFFSITRTKDEISLVGESYKWMPDSYKEQSTWRAIKILGPIEHNADASIADFTAALKAAKVPVFTLSTWSTDYILVPSEMLNDVIRVLERDGWLFEHGVKNRVARL
ncbi:hypothetical protein BDQ17DRAFT_63643 [Cyathus striatus]|nr:hypothetical protein BDQ17DRAFT_63643 [Cyathus striatus]